MENPYLDWVFVDALMFAELITCYKTVMFSKYGIGFVLFGRIWKAVIFRTFSLPIIFALGWIAPGAFCLWLYSKYPTASLTIAAIYYGLSVLMVIRYKTQLVLFRLRVGKWPRQEQLGRAKAVEDAYAELREEIIHVPSLRRAIECARDLGVVWDPQILAIIDRVAAKTPTVWIRRLPHS